MSVQSRVKAGNDFEKLICEKFGWEHKSTCPKIIWSGVGRSNFDKIESVNFDSDKFRPTTESVYHKWDAVKPNGDKVEIKSYLLSKLRDWNLYSEPMFKVADRKTLSKVVRIFGGGNKELSVRNYNLFVERLSRSGICEDILKRITESNIGIQLIDGFVNQSDLEYRWNLVPNWEGYLRLTIQFKIKNP
jgi:hypothetical protein